MKTSVTALLFLLLLAPSAWIAWRNREMPQFGRTHDDAIHYITAKSLAEGKGYRIQNMPGAPYETKYPPLLPWLLAAVYRVYPVFPTNLVLVSAMQWAFVPPLLWMAWTWFRRVGLSVPQQWFALVLLAISPYTAVLGSGLYTELIFTFLLLSSLLMTGEVLTGKRVWRWAVLAGALGGLAFLTRTAGIVLLVSTPLALLTRKKFRAGAAFCAAMLPFVLGWTVWSKLHKDPSTDITWIYNTDYFGYLLASIRDWNDALVMVKRNIPYLPDTMGAAIFPVELSSMFYQMLRTTVAVGIVSGLWRNRSRLDLLPYVIFAAITLAELALWSTANLRLMYPLVPLLLAGAAWEGTHISETIRCALNHKDRSQRVAAWGMASAAAVFCLTAIYMHGLMNFSVLPDMIRADEAMRAQNLAAYRWIQANTPPDAHVIANNPGLFLYTGRQTVPLLIPQRYWYHGDNLGILAIFRDLSDYAQKRHLAYLYLSDADYRAFEIPELVPEARHALESNPRWRPLFHTNTGTVFRLGEPAGTASPIARR